MLSLLFVLLELAKEAFELVEVRLPELLGVSGFFGGSTRTESCLQEKQMTFSFDPNTGGSSSFERFCFSITRLQSAHLF